jgi:hypothetical protein
MSDYMEDTSFELPACLENGVQNIGDLWDCRESVPLNLNLLSQELSGKYLTISPPKNEKKTHLHHLKNTEDKLNKIDVNGEIKLELLAGLINAGASAGFKSEKSSDDVFEKIALQYDLKTYSVELPSASDEILNKHVLKLIKDKKIKATHVVTKVFFGASIETTMTFTHKINHSSRKISGISNFNPILKQRLCLKLKQEV